MARRITLRRIRQALQAPRAVRNWPAYYAELLRLSGPGERTYVFRDGRRYLARGSTTDRGILNTVAILDEYRLEAMGLRDAVIIDIGGQAGFFAVFASRFAKAIYSYEPMPENFALLQRNVALNGLQDVVKAHHLAVADTHEPLRIYRSASNTGGHSMFGGGASYEETPSTTLADIFADHGIETCDLLKLDAEGAEYPVLYALPDALFPRIRNLRMEVHPVDQERRNAPALIAFLESKGFEVTWEEPLLYASRRD